MTQPLPVESTRDVHAHLAEVVERADRDDVPTVITRRGKEVAAVDPLGFNTTALASQPERRRRHVVYALDNGELLEAGPGVPGASRTRTDPGAPGCYGAGGGLSRDGGAPGPRPSPPSSASRPEPASK